MKGIQYIVDDNGAKTAVVIDLKQWGSLWEEFYHTLAKTAYPDEQWLQQSEVIEKLDQALEWNAKNHPQVSDLETLESQLNNYEQNSA